MNACAGCGRTWPWENGPSTIHCSECPPWHCGRCDRMVDMNAHFNCGTCVMRFKDMPLADIKAALADIDLSVGGLAPGGAGEAQEG